jgi:hypothetical protein
MDNDPASHTSRSAVCLIIYWAVVSLPLAWGIWKTAVKLPALFQ